MIKIRSVIGHEQVDTACRCLASLVRQCRNEFAFAIHDDGTLLPDDLNKLQQVLGPHKVTARGTADRLTYSRLKDFPACLKYREEHPWGLKLFDICLLHDTDELVYFCDSDVLFLRPFTFPASVGKNMAVFMQDSQQAFALRPWHVKPFGPMKVMSRLNTGLMMVDAAMLDLSYLESILINQRLSHVFSQRPGWVEQTCWAALATRIPTYLFDRKQVCVAHQGMGDVTLDRIAIHFVSAFRGMLEGYLGSEVLDREQASTLRLEKAVRASVLDLARSELTRFI